MNNPDAAQSPRDRVLHVADLHFWKVVLNPLRLANKRFLGNLNVILKRRHEYRTSQAGDFTKALVATGLREAIFTGDLTSSALDEEFDAAAAFLNNLSQDGMRLLVLPGNHDVYTFESVRRARWQHKMAQYLLAEGYPALTTLSGGTPVLLIPTVKPNFLTARGRIAIPVLKKTEQLLEKLPPGPLIVAAHYPLLHRTQAYTSNYGRRLEGAETLRALLSQTNRPILHIAGHVHRFSLTRDAQYPSLLHLTTGALFRSHGPQPQGEFSEIHIPPGGYTIFHHQFNGTWTRSQITPAS